MSSIKPVCTTNNTMNKMNNGEKMAATNNTALLFKSLAANSNLRLNKRRTVTKQGGA
jgi:hypothetical protein